MPPDASAYHRQIEAARAVGLTLTAAQLDAFLRLLETYAEELASRVTGELGSRGDRAALVVAQEVIRQLTRDLALSTRNGVTITASRVSEIYSTATVGLIEAGGVGLEVGAVFAGLDARAAQAVLSRPELSRAFRTIRASSVETVDALIQRAVLRGATPAQLGRELRVHVIGADAFPERLLLDRRRIGFEAIRSMGYDPTPENLRTVRKLAGQISGKARLIARTEIMNAEWEAHIQGAADSPVVKAIRWKLSSRHPKKDVCDILAEQDIYGLGPGLYDPRRVPPRPHPRDLCIQEDVLIESPEDFGRPRGPVPDRQADVDRLIDIYELPPSQKRQLAAALDVADRTFRERREAA